MEKKVIDWSSVLFICGYHLALLIGLPIYFMTHTPSLAVWMVGLFLFSACNLSITCGYHRYYSHNSYKLNGAVQAVMLFFATLAVQASAIKWGFLHRHHHAFVDTARDPYSIQEGFWHAHVLWTFGKTEKIDPKVVPDLFKNPMTAFQHRHYVWLMVGTNVLTTLLIGYLLNDYAGAFAITLGLRLFLCNHTTWFINSIAHTWGKQSYGQEHSAKDNFIISFLTFGEGYHNYHHTFANDYRNGIRWFDYDPSKWTIWLLSKLGLAKDLRRTDESRIRKHLLEEQKGEILAKVKAHFADQFAPIEAKLTKISQDLVEKYQRFQKLKTEYSAVKKQKNSEKSKELTKEISLITSLIRQEYSAWQSFYKSVMHFNPSSGKKLPLPS